MSQEKFLKAIPLNGMPSYDEMGGRIKIRKKENAVRAQSQVAETIFYEATGSLNITLDFENYSYDAGKQKGSYMIFTAEFSAATYDRMKAVSLTDSMKAVIKIEANGEIVPYTFDELEPKIYKEDNGDYTFSFIRQVGGENDLSISDVIFNLYPDGVYENSYAIHFDMSKVNIIEADPSNIKMMTIEEVYGTLTYYVFWINRENIPYESARIYMMDMNGQKVKEATATGLVEDSGTSFFMNAEDQEEGVYKIIVKTIDKNGFVQDYGRSLFYNLAKVKDSNEDDYYKFI